MNENYTKGEVDLKFSGLQSILEVQFDAHTKLLNGIQEQTKKTNGRVSLLEKMMWSATGAVTVLSFWAVWLTNDSLKSKEELSPLQQSAIREAAQEGLIQAIKNYGKDT